MMIESSAAATRLLIRKARFAGKSVGCVPTMGALHPGHASLIGRARESCDFVVTTIFVNPTQFGPNEDFTRYPRTLEQDLEICRKSGADLVFTPEVREMYQPDAQTIVRVTQLSSVLEGAHRPGHFDGVSTVVAKLFLITEPDLAFFGQKDYQQQLIIRRMVSDLNLPVEIVTCPIVRESDGLAMSSRNRYLSAEERTAAAALSAALKLAERLAAETHSSPGEIEDQMAAFLQSTDRIELQYAVVVDTDTLEKLNHRPPTGVALVAARVGTTRLIDNTLLRFASEEFH